MKAEEEYKRMTRKERKVAIAKDVIKQINAGVFSIKSEYGYVAPKIAFSLSCTISKENALDVAKKCHMCARGAMMISRIAKFNEVEIGVWHAASQSDTTVALEDAFGVGELALIEMVFEGIEMVFEGNHWLASSTARSFYEDHPNDADRLIAICQNIIDHNGTFKPEVRYDVKYV